MRHERLRLTLFEIDSPVTISIKYLENMLREAGRVAEWKELLVDFCKAALVELATRTVLVESPVPAK